MLPHEDQDFGIKHILIYYDKHDQSLKENYLCNK